MNILMTSNLKTTPARAIKSKNYKTKRTTGKLVDPLLLNPPDPPQYLEKTQATVVHLMRASTDYSWADNAIATTRAIYDHDFRTGSLPQEATP